MKKYLITLMVAASALSVMVVNTAEAKRLGGGGSSFGKQSSNVTNKAPAAAPAPPSQAAKPAAAPAPTPAAPAGVPPKPASPWKGMLGGALLGLGLGAMLSHFGLGGAMASFISTLLMVGLLALAAMFIFRMFRRKDAPAAQRDFNPAFAGGAPAMSNTPEIGSRVEPMSLQQPGSFPAGQSGTVAAMDQAGTWTIPSDFDTAGFLRNAKSYFIRLQAAWDKGDSADIREFTTPEMFAELKMQLHERGAAANHTDVVSLNADLLGIEQMSDEYLASVKFSGMIKEAENASAEPFQEVWNLSKPVNGQGGWLLAGIQQLS